MQLSERPLVSVLMTAYNREKYVEEAIKSVLASKFEDFELIILDDASTDHTVSIANKYASMDRRVKVLINDHNLGDYPNRNKAATLALGKYIKYLDSDDVIYPYSMSIFVDCMEEFPNAALGITSKSFLPNLPFPILLSPHEAYHRHFFEYGLLDYGPSGVIIRKDIFFKMGCFSGKRFVGDQECWLKIAAIHPVLELPPSLVYWRRHVEQEYTLGDAGIDGGYFLMNLSMIRDAICDPDSPLTEQERKYLLNRQYKHYGRTLVKHALKTGQLNKVYRKFRDLQLPLSSLI